MRMTALSSLEYVFDQNEFVVEAVATHTDYLENAASSDSSSACPMRIEKPKDEDIYMEKASIKRDYVRYTVQDKIRWIKWVGQARFFNLKIEKCMNASAAAKQLSIHIRTARRQVKQYKMCPDSIVEVCKQVGRKHILGEEHEAAVVNFIDVNFSATVVEVIEHLLKRFHDLKVSRSTVYSFTKSECNLLLKKQIFILLRETVQQRLRSSTIRFVNGRTQA